MLVAPMRVWIAWAKLLFLACPGRLRPNPKVEIPKAEIGAVSISQGSLKWRRQCSQGSEASMLYEAVETLNAQVAMRS
jgi:hypothetical protein